MKILITYFSQTGNTKKVAQAISEYFQEENHQVTCISILENISNFHQYDIIGIGSPTFECHAPTPIKTFIKSLPNLSGKQAFIFATSAGAAGNVLNDIKQLLKQKGSVITNSLLSPGEMHHPAPCINGKSKGHPNKKDLENVKYFASTILNNIENKSKQNFNGLKPKFGFYTIVGKITQYDGLIRFLVPSPRCDTNKCINCNKCIQECPMNAINKKPQPIINNKCIRCYRCTSVCLQNSFKVNWWFGNLVILLFWNKYFMTWFGEYKKEDEDP